MNETNEKSEGTKDDDTEAKAINEEQQGETEGADIVPAATPPKLYPDGGWGWFVVAGSAFGRLLGVGVVRSFGVFYLELLDKFQQSATATAWVIALHNTIRQVMGK